MTPGMPLRPPPILAVAIMAGALAGVLPGCAAVSVALVPTPVTLATGTPGGLYHPVGNAICRMFNLPTEHQAVPCVAVSSDGAVANILKVKAGTSTFGMSQTDVAYAAFHGEGPFATTGPSPALRSVIALYPEAFTVIARADAGIRDFRDLRGRRIGIGTTGAGYTFTRDVVLGFYGWTISDADRVLEVGPAEQNRALCNNEVDAIVFATGHPSGLAQVATTECRARVVRVAGPSIERLLAAHSYYVASVIPGGLYPDNPRDVPTFGTLAVLITTSRQPDALAYAAVKAIFDNFDDFRRLHPVLATVRREDLVPSDAVIPIHPGALRYYRETGLIR